MTKLSRPHGSGGTASRIEIPLPSVNSQLSIGVHSGWTSASTAGSTRNGSPFSPYGVSAPRSFRLSMMLLRARFAVIAW